MNMEREEVNLENSQRGNRTKTTLFSFAKRSIRHSVTKC